MSKPNNISNRPHRAQEPPSYVNFQSESRTPESLTISWRERSVKPPYRKHQNWKAPRLHHRSSAQWVRAHAPAPHPGAPGHRLQGHHQMAASGYRPGRYWEPPKSAGYRNQTEVAIKLSSLQGSVHETAGRNLAATNRLASKFEHLDQEHQKLARQVKDYAKELSKVNRKLEQAVDLIRTLMVRSNYNAHSLEKISTLVEGKCGEEDKANELAHSALANRKENGSPHPKTIKEESSDSEWSDSD